MRLHLLQKQKEKESDALEEMKLIRAVEESTEQRNKNNPLFKMLEKL